MANEDLEVDEGNAVLTGAATGAAAGAVGGPIGAVIGAGIGGVIGFTTAQSQNAASKKALQRRNEALAKANFLKTAARRQTDSLRQTNRKLGATTPDQSSAAPSALPSGSTPTSAIGGGISSAGNF